MDVPTDQSGTRHAGAYWAVLKKRLKDRGAINWLQKKRNTDIADTEQILRVTVTVGCETAPQK